MGWAKPLAVDGAMVISIAPKVTPKYATWWTTMCQGPLDFDELDIGSDSAMSPPLKEEN